MKCQNFHALDILQGKVPCGLPFEAYRPVCFIPLQGALILPDDKLGLALPVHLDPENNLTVKLSGNRKQPDNLLFIFDQPDLGIIINNQLRPLKINIPVVAQMSMNMHPQTM